MASHFPKQPILKYCSALKSCILLRGKEVPEVLSNVRMVSHACRRHSLTLDHHVCHHKVDYSLKVFKLEVVIGKVPYYSA